MLSYPYLLTVYRSILAHSAAIGGRVYMAPFFANELNTENLQQILADSLSGTIKKQYPLSLVLPPISDNDVPSGRSFGGFTSWDDYTIHQLFLKQEGRTSDGQVQDIDIYTNNSQHTITQDWHDMRRVAINFITLLREVVVDTALGKHFRVSDKASMRIVPVTHLGTDRANGVMISYRVSIFDMCAREDYPAGAGSMVAIPAPVDEHPEHRM